MQTKYQIDRDTRTLILKYIRKYDEYRLWYRAERDRIMSPPSAAMRISGVKDATPKDSTLSAVEALERLDGNHRVQVVHAIDSARNQIGYDIQSKKEQNAIRRAIWLSCINGREYSFDAFAGAVCYEQRQFYRCKNMFLNNIKDNLGL